MKLRLDDETLPCFSVETRAGFAAGLHWHCGCHWWPAGGGDVYVPDMPCGFVRDSRRRQQLLPLVSGRRCGCPPKYSLLSEQNSHPPPPHTHQIPVLPNCSPSGSVCTANSTAPTLCSAGEPSTSSTCIYSRIPFSRTPFTVSAVGGPVLFHISDSSSPLIAQINSNRTLDKLPVLARRATTVPSLATPRTLAMITAWYLGWIQPATMVRGPLCQCVRLPPFEKACHLRGGELCVVCAGQEYSTDLGICVTCTGGSQRMVGRDDFCMPW